MSAIGLVLALISLAGWAWRERQLRAALQIAREERGAAHRGVRLVLDCVDQGLLMVAPDGRVATERSRAADRLLGAPVRGARLWELLGPELEPAWRALFEGKLAVSELPQQVTRRGRELAVRYEPVMEDGRLMSVLVLVSSQEHAQDRREMLRLLEWAVRDPGLCAFLRREASDAVETVADDLGRPADQRRALQGLQEHASLLGLERLAGHCRAMNQPLPQEQREGLRQRWLEAQALFEPLRSLLETDALTVEREEFEALLRSVRSGVAGETLAQRLERWGWEPASLHLQRLATRARLLASRLGRPAPEIRLDCPPVRLPDRWQPFWAAAAELVHNAVCHGLPAEKHGLLSISVRQSPEGVFVSFQDNGKGIDWKSIAGDAHTRDERLSALFADGHGLGAVWSATEQLGGAVQVESEPGAGTTIRFWFPPGSAQQTPLSDRLTA